ncbi:MAG: flagellar biosynthetic protein FliR [Pseudomonadota bacterium]
MNLTVADDVMLVTLVFARIGSALMVLPLFGEAYVLSRARLILALTLSLVLTPVLAPTLGSVGAVDGAYAGRVVTEAIHGLFIGSLVRLAIAALSIAGAAIAMQMGFGAANFFNPGEAQQSSATGNLMTIAGLAGLLAIDGHHMMLHGLVASYEALPPTAGLQAADMAAAFARGSADAVVIGVQMAMPMTAVALVLYAILGMMNRLVPTLQVIFVAMPVQIIIGLGLLGITLPAVIERFVAFAIDLTAVLGA